MQHGFNGAAIAAAEKQSAVIIVPGQQLKIDSFFSDGRKENLHRLKKNLKQTDKQRVFILVSCVDCSRGDAGFFGDLVQRGFLKTVSKKLRIGSLNDPVIQGMIPSFRE